MSVFKYRDPKTGQVKKVGTPSINTYSKEEIDEMKPTYVPHTMSASKWSGNTYSFESIYPHASYNISIEVAPTTTVEQFEVFGEAMICGSHNSNVYTAIGDVPTVDIPIIVEVTKK